MNVRALGAIAFLIAVSLGGCTTMPDTAAVPDAAHNSRNSLDWAGTYKGVLPCADCEGIETIVTLRVDGSYSATSRYLGKDGTSTASQGNLTWNDEGSTISLTGEEPARYRVAENRLIRLALDGSRITGPLADHYVLTKMTDAITEKYWKLVELGGQPVPRLDKEPHIILKAEGSRVTGFGGCNSFTGSYTLDEARSRIRFGQVASTMEACPSGMDVERTFSEVLGQVDNYSMNGDHLTFNRARMAPLARFEAVYLR
jgi:heat shock protein HslJ